MSEGRPLACSSRPNHSIEGSSAASLVQLVRFGGFEQPLRAQIRFSCEPFGQGSAASIVDERVREQLRRFDPRQFVLCGSALLQSIPVAGSRCLAHLCACHAKNDDYAVRNRGYISRTASPCALPGISVS